MRSILKYTITEGVTTVLSMREKSEILSVQNQDEYMVIWVLSDDNLPFEERTFETYWTGQSIRDPEKLRYVGTALFDNGNFVSHLFEKIG